MWERELHGAVFFRNIEARTLREKGLKTSKKGVKVKVAWFSDHLESLLAELAESHDPDDLLFTVDGRPLVLETANKHFKVSLTRAGIPIVGRTQYSLRHTAYTLMMEHFDLKTVQGIFGHTATDRRTITEMPSVSSDLR